MKQFNIKNIALAAVLMCSVGDAFADAAAAAAAVAAAVEVEVEGADKGMLSEPHRSTLHEAPGWAREHLKTLFTGCATAAIAAFALYATVCVQKIKKQLKKFESTPRNNKAMQLRAELNNWLFLRNTSWVACAGVGVLTAVGTAHHLTKHSDWAINAKNNAFWAKFGRAVLFHDPKSVGQSSTKDDSDGDSSISKNMALSTKHDGAPQGHHVLGGRHPHALPASSGAVTDPQFVGGLSRGGTTHRSSHPEPAGAAVGDERETDSPDSGSQRSRAISTFDGDDSSLPELERVVPGGDTPPEMGAGDLGKHSPEGDPGH